MTTKTPTQTQTPSIGRTMPVVLSVPEAAVLLGMSRRSCYRAVEAEAIPNIRVGRRIMIPTARLMSQLGLPLDDITWQSQPPALRRPGIEPEGAS